MDKPRLGYVCQPRQQKIQNYVTRYPFWECKKTDSLQCPLQDIKECYANPPWTVIGQWLIRLKEHPHLTCWVIVPFWASMFWWPLLAKMQVPGSPAIIIDPFQGMFKNCLEEDMPPQGGPSSPLYYQANFGGKENFS